MTEDMHEERLQAVEAFGDSFVSWKTYQANYLTLECFIIWCLFRQFCLQLLWISSYVATNHIQQTVTK